MIERGARREIGNRVLLDLVALGLRAALALSLVGCGGGYRPAAPALPPASTSGESVIGQIGDEQLTLRLREGLTAKGLAPAVSPYVYIAHAFLVGRVHSAKRVEQALEVAAGVQGLASIDSYIVVRPKGARTSSDDASVAGTARIMLGANPAARAGHVDVVSIDGHIVLLGVVPSAEARASVEATARGVGGVTGVTNFLLLPERQ
jgi:osmotically-inducible protein OsmY